MGQDQGFKTSQNPIFFFSILQKMFHQNKQFDKGLVVLCQKMKELLKFKISKMDPVHPVGCPKITPNLKCLAPDADSGAKFQVLMESDQKN